MGSQIVEIASTAPPTLDHVVGQKQAVQQLRVALAAFWNDRAAGQFSSFGSVLMVGPKGTGKTMLAKVLAGELGASLKETLGQTLGMGEDLHGLLLEATDDTVVFIDEAHLMSEYAQTAIFKAVEERKLFVPRSPISSKMQCITLSRFILVLATTDPHGILGPLRDRMKLILQLDYYLVEELAELCRQRAQALRWEVEAEVLNLIAARARSTPRLALRLLESCRRTARAEDAAIISVAHFHRTIELEALDGELGLDKSEQAYLKSLSESDGKARLHLIASRLGQPPRTVAEVTESFLIREGLVTRSDNGRELTAKGWEYVKRNRQS